MMKIRHYKAGEERILWSLFYNTIHRINARDYSQSQLDAWAYAQLDSWHRSRTALVLRW